MTTITVTFKGHLLGYLLSSVSARFSVTSAFQLHLRIAGRMRTVDGLHFIPSDIETDLPFYVWHIILLTVVRTDVFLFCWFCLSTSIISTLKHAPKGCLSLVLISTQLYTTGTHARANTSRNISEKYLFSVFCNHNPVGRLSVLGADLEV